MKRFELKSTRNFKHVSLPGLCLVLGVWLLVQTGCSRGPEPVALELEIEEDTSVSITLTTASPSDSGVKFQISSLPIHGSVSGTPPKVRYTPPANYFGDDQFAYVTLRGNGRVSKPATVKIDVASVNDPPVAESLEATTGVNSTVLIQPQAIDVDGTVVEYQIAESPGYGEAELVGAQFRYTPRTGFLGEDSFEYVAIDETGLQSAKAQVTVHVSVRHQPQDEVAQQSEASESQDATAEPTEAVTTTTPDTITPTNVPDNSVPTVKDMEVVVSEDSDVLVELNATDSDGTVSRFGITTLPLYGTLIGTGSKRTYAPNENYFGADSFAYVAIDDQGGVSKPAVVSITVDSVNDRPIADSSSWVTVEDSTGIYIDLRTDDLDGTVSSISVVKAPRHGRIDDVGNNRLLYVPYENFSGYDSFQWVAIDDEGARSLEATTTITVSEQPDPPSIRLRKTQYETTVGEHIDFDIRVTDPENDVDRFEVRQTQRANGKFIPNRGSISQLKHLRFEATKRGVSTYGLEVRDRSGLTAFTTFTIEVVNTPPIVQLPIPSYDRTAGTVNFRLRAHDPDGTIDHFVIQTIDNRRAGSIKVNGKSVTDAVSFTTGGSCETEDGAWCTLNVKYKPDVIDGHSRRIRVYAVDDEGASSPKDFIRIETRQLRVASHVEDDEEEDDDGTVWTPPNPRIPPYTRTDPPEPVTPPPDNTETTRPGVTPPVVDEEEDEEDDTEDEPERDSDEVIAERVDKEEIKQVTDPNREVPRERR